MISYEYLSERYDEEIQKIIKKYYEQFTSVNTEEPINWFDYIQPMLYELQDVEESFRPDIEHLKDEEAEDNYNSACDEYDIAVGRR